MTFFLRQVAAVLLLACVFTGCSTPQRRAREHGSAFRRLSPSDQSLVLHGHVRPGLSQEGVYIAWGQPDEKVAGGSDKNDPGVETWIYRQRITISEPQNSYDYYGPYQGIDHAPAAPALSPGYGIGGIGNEALMRFQPHVRCLDTLRIAEFKRGEVERFETADGNWSTRTGAEIVAGQPYKHRASNAPTPMHEHLTAAALPRGRSRHGRTTALRSFSRRNRVAPTAIAQRASKLRQRQRFPERRIHRVSRLVKA